MSTEAALLLTCATLNLTRGNTLSMPEIRKDVCSSNWSRGSTGMIYGRQESLRYDQYAVTGNQLRDIAPSGKRADSSTARPGMAWWRQAALHAPPGIPSRGKVFTV